MNPIDFVSRFFAPSVGVSEDPVTGSAHTLLTPFWSKKLDKKRLRCASDLKKRRQYLPALDNGDRVKIGGSAITFLKALSPFDSNDFRIIGLLVIGIFTGIIAGIFGIGGGVLFTPILFFLFNSAGVEQPVAWTIGTSLFCTFSAALSSSIQQRNQKNSYLKEGIRVGSVWGDGCLFRKTYFNLRVLHRRTVCCDFCMPAFDGFIYVLQKGKIEEIIGQTLNEEACFVREIR